MRYLRQGVQSVQQNLWALFAYASVMAGLRTADILLTSSPDSTSEESLTALQIVWIVVLVLVTSLTQTVVFSKLAHNLDKPLWKLAGIAQALRRHLGYWLLANALFAVLMILGFVAPCMVVGITYIFVGACRMFRWDSSWTDVFRPFRREFPAALVLITFTGVMFVSYFMFMEGVQDRQILQPLVEIIFAYADLVIFSATWNLCMKDRETPDDVDFEF